MRKRGNKILSMVLAVCMVIALLPAMHISAGAASKKWDGSEMDISWYHASKTSFTISTPAELAGLELIVNSGKDSFVDKTITLTADIDLNNKEWTPIGNGSTGFSGSFDGNGHVIRNIAIGTEEGFSKYYANGLFGWIFYYGEISNLGLENVVIYGGSYGYSYGNNGGLTGWNNGKITNCYVTGNIKGGYDSTNGGLVGINEGGVITNSYADVSVSDGEYNGGLVGRNTVGCIENSYATGNIEGGKYSCNGGLIGRNDGNIINSYALGNVKGGIGSTNGGFIGEQSGTTTNCYATGNVLGGYFNGGLLGVNSGEIINSYATGDVAGEKNIDNEENLPYSINGGLAGTNNGIIDNCYTASNVTGGVESNTGGLVGINENTIVNSYWNSANQTDIYANTNTVTGCMGKQLADMKTKDFADLLNANNVVADCCWIQQGDNTPVILLGNTESSDGKFEDISANDWFYDAVEYVAEKGVMNGISGEVFAPNTNLSRAMMVQILYNLEGKPKSDCTAFYDTKADAWYASAVSWAAENDIVSGYGNGFFGPNDSVTREQMAAILYRYMDYKDISYIVTEEYRIFADEDEISGYAKNAIQILNKLKIMNGVGGNRINPKGNAKRSEVAQMMMNFLLSIEKQG